LSFDNSKKLSPCIDTAVRLQIGRNGNEDDMGCFPALVVKANHSLRTRIDNFGELNNDVQMGGSVLLLARQYGELSEVGASNYKFEKNENTGREFNGLLFSGSAVSDVVLQGDNKFGAQAQPVLSVKNSSVKVTDMSFVNTQKAIDVICDISDTYEINIENCLFDLGESDAVYVYHSDANTIASRSNLLSKIRITLQNTTSIHGATAGDASIVYLDDTDKSDTLVYVNNIDVIRNASGFVADNYNLISVPDASQIGMLVNNATWQGNGLIVDRDVSDTQWTFGELCFRYAMDVRGVF